jgi:hypothetical protein
MATEAAQLKRKTHLTLTGLLMEGLALAEDAYADHG